MDNVSNSDQQLSSFVPQFQTQRRIGKTFAPNRILFQEQLNQIKDQQCKFVPVQFKDKFIQYLLWQSLLKQKNEGIYNETGSTQTNVLRKNQNYQEYKKRIQIGKVNEENTQKPEVRKQNKKQSSIMKLKSLTKQVPNSANPTISYDTNTKNNKSFSVQNKTTRDEKQLQQQKLGQQQQQSQEMSSLQMSSGKKKLDTIRVEQNQQLIGKQNVVINNVKIMKPQLLYSHNAVSAQNSRKHQNSDIDFQNPQSWKNKNVDQIIIAANKEIKEAQQSSMPKPRVQKQFQIQKSGFREIESEEGFQQYLQEKQIELINLEEKMYMENYMKSIGLNYVDMSQQNEGEINAQHIQLLHLNDTNIDDQNKKMKINFVANKKRDKSATFSQKYSKIRKRVLSSKVVNQSFNDSLQVVGLLDKIYEIKQ